MKDTIENTEIQENVIVVTTWRWMVEILYKLNCTKKIKACGTNCNLLPVTLKGYEQTMEKKSVTAHIFIKLMLRYRFVNNCK